ncbi:MAG TPA: SMC family ATPase, partial [Mycobacteriales bacterium]|nr:SMC family ATPase [Mycobacteriales bacterium]
MRPVLLDMHGFGSFRERSTVDFREVDYFALVGPTGAGKSTVVDAIVFALYGSVPRWDDRKVVGLALAPSVNRGVVRLVFDVGGARYSVVRDLRRSARGQVTVRNARLERLADPVGLGEQDTEVLAADGAVTGAVERLLGLTYEHFVTCVVLPQGDFAEFLHEKPAKRQEVLIRLLGLEVYQRVAQAANTEAAQQRQRADLAADQLSRYADATEDAERAARARIEEVERLDEDVRRRVPELVAAAGRLAEAERECRRLATEAEILSALRVPAGIDALDTEAREVAVALRAAQEELAEAEDGDAKARDARDAGPPRLPLERARDRWAELARLDAGLPALTAAHAALGGALREVEAAGRSAR